MNEDLRRAVCILTEGNYTCVLYRADAYLTDSQRGIRPLLELLESGRDLNGFCAADKVVGMAAAFLYRLMGIKAVWASVISSPAVRILTEGGIAVYWDAEVPAILNRSHTGLCPMETAVRNSETPREALLSIKETLAD